jgi:hypothetical protein
MPSHTLEERSSGVAVEKNDFDFRLNLCLQRELLIQGPDCMVWTSFLISSVRSL